MNRHYPDYPKRDFPIETTVKRGPTWVWGDQDQEGFGKVIRHLPTSIDWHFNLSVKWDKGGQNAYRAVGGWADVIPIVLDKTFNDYL